MTDFFNEIPKIKYEGQESENDFCFRHYNPDEIVLGKPLKDVSMPIARSLNACGICGILL